MTIIASVAKRAVCSPSHPRFLFLILFFFLQGQDKERQRNRFLSLSFLLFISQNMGSSDDEIGLAISCIPGRDRLPATEAALLLDGGLLPGQVAWNRRSWREAQADVQINFFSNLRREDEKTDLWTAFTIAQQDIPETLGKLPQEHLVLYIHGFNNRPSNPSSMAPQLQAIFDAAGSHVRGKV